MSGLLSMQANQFGLENFEMSLEEMLLQDSINTTDVAILNSNIENGETVKETLERVESASTPEEKLEIVTETLFLLLGSNKSISVEQFNGIYNQHYTISTEGLWTRIKETLKYRSFIKGKILSDIEDIRDKLRTKNTREKTIIRSPGYSNNFTDSGSVVTFSTIVKQLNENLKEINNSSIVSFFNECTDLINKVNKATAIENKLNKGSDLYNVEKIEGISKTLQNKLSHVNNSKYSKKDCQTLNEKECYDLLNMIEKDILELDKHYYAILNKYSNAVVQNYKSFGEKYIKLLLISLIPFAVIITVPAIIYQGMNHEYHVSLVSAAFNEVMNRTCDAGKPVAEYVKHHVTDFTNCSHAALQLIKASI